MSRADRWWRPSTSRRPAQRARSRRMYNGKELDNTFNIGYSVGQADERKKIERRDEQITRLAQAADAAANGDPSLLDEIARECADDDLLDVADAAGVLSEEEDKALWDSVQPHGSGMVVEIEQWLRDRDRWQDDE